MRTVPAPVRMAPARAPFLHVATRGLAADPLRIARRQRTPPVQAGRQLHAQPRPAAFDARKEAAIERARLSFHQSQVDLDAGGAQAFEARAINLRERIAHGADDARDTRFDQCVRARPGAAHMGAGFQRHVDGGAARTRTGLLQGEHFRVRPALALVPAGADDLVALRDHAADHRIGLGGVRAALGQAQGAGHHGVVGRGERGLVGVLFHRRRTLSTGSPSSKGSCPSPGRSRSRRSSSSRKSATSSNERYTDAKRT